MRLTKLFILLETFISSAALLELSVEVDSDSTAHQRQGTISHIRRTSQITLFSTCVLIIIKRQKQSLREIPELIGHNNVLAQMAVEKLDFVILV